MEKFTTLTAVAAPLRMINVDTDQLVPKQFMKTIKRTGLSIALFHEQRFTLDGQERPDFILNKTPYRGSKILIAGDNFGCGSSREHAPWALLDYGIRCVIAPRFGDIFFNNCFKNGILPIRLPEEVIKKFWDLADNGANATFTVDLEAQEITTPDGEKVPFEVDPYRKHCLLNGLDDIGLTMQKEPSINAYEDRLAVSQPWMTPRAVV